MFLQAFLAAVLQDHGRSQGVPTDSLTFSHHVISNTSDVSEEELPIAIQRKLSLIRRAFKVMGSQDFLFTFSVVSC